MFWKQSHAGPQGACAKNLRYNIKIWNQDVLVSLFLKVDDVLGSLVRFNLKKTSFHLG